MELTDSKENRLMKELQDVVKEPFFMQESSHADDTHEDESTMAVAKPTAHDTCTSASQQLSMAYNVQVNVDIWPQFSISTTAKLKFIIINCNSYCLHVEIFLCSVLARSFHFQQQQSCCLQYFTPCIT